MRKLKIAGTMAGWVLGGMLAGAAVAAAAVAAPATVDESRGVTAAQRTFTNGLRAYLAKDYGRAREVFVDLAALGDGPSMYNLGAMAFRGEGVEKSTGTAVGWWRAAAEADYDAGVALADKYEPKLDAAGKAARDAILAEHGQSRLFETVLPDRERDGCDALPGVLSVPVKVSHEAGKYPTIARMAAMDGYVLMDVTITADGRLVAPRVVAVLPPGGEIADAFVRSAAESALAARYKPWAVDGRAVPGRRTIKFNYAMRDGRGVLLDGAAFQHMRAIAAEGDPAATFIVGAIGEIDPSLGIERGQARDMMLVAAQAGVPEAQFRVARLTAPELASCPRPPKSMVWLRRAAANGLPEARTMLARELLALPEPPMAEISQLLLIGPRDALPRHVQRELLAAWLASPHAELRNPAAALVLARVFLPGDDGSLQDLEIEAAILFAEGKAPAAARKQSKAIEMARGFGWETGAMQGRLADYTAGKPAFGDLLALPVPLAAAGPGEAVAKPVAAR